MHYPAPPTREAWTPWSRTVRWADPRDRCGGRQQAHTRWVEHGLAAAGERRPHPGRVHTGILTGRAEAPWECPIGVNVSQNVPEQEQRQAKAPLLCSRKETSPSILSSGGTNAYPP